MEIPNVMLDYFKPKFITATSPPVEGYIDKLKTKFSKPLSADRFIASHLKMIEAKIKISRRIQLENVDKFYINNNIFAINSEEMFEKKIIENVEFHSDLAELNLSNNDGFNNIKIEDDVLNESIKTNSSYEFEVGLEENDKYGIIEVMMSEDDLTNDSKVPEDYN